MRYWIEAKGAGYYPAEWYRYRYCFSKQGRTKLLKWLRAHQHGLYFRASDKRTPADCTDSISVLAPSIARLAAENAALKARCKVLEDALRGLFDLCAIMKFEPDAGQPHPLKDGIFDKLIHAARKALDIA